MKAGRELDALVAEKVMGWTNIRTSQFVREILVGKPSPTSAYESIDPYSTDIAAAWQVVEKMNGRDNMQLDIRTRNGCTWAAFKPIVRLSNTPKSMPSKANTVEMAICLAALKAVGVQLPENAQDVV